MDTDLLVLVAKTARRGRRITAGKLTGQKPALKMKEVWAIRARLELGRRVRDLALFNLAIDSMLLRLLAGKAWDRRYLPAGQAGANG